MYLFEPVFACPEGPAWSSRLVVVQAAASHGRGMLVAQPDIEQPPRPPALSKSFRDDDGRPVSKAAVHSTTAVDFDRLVAYAFVSATQAPVKREQKKSRSP